MASDATASDGVCVVRPGNQDASCETQARLWFGLNPGVPEAGARYRCFAVVKCELTGTQGKAFGLGIYDADTDQDLVSLPIAASQVASGQWQTYEAGTVDLKRFRQPLTLWVGMAGNPDNVKSVAVDRLFLVPAP